MTVRVRAPGKVNLYLAAGRRREDGYHPLATIFQAVDLYDTITVRPADTLTLTMAGLGADLPVDDSNLAIRAARQLADFAGMLATADISIHKSIPVAGGMAGGSADAAGTLLALDRLWNVGLSSQELRRIGAQLGADVPFCLTGGTALGLGHGDELTPLLSRGSYSWVLVTQPRGLSTPAVFAAFDDAVPDAPEVPEVDERFIAALTQGDTGFVARSARNDLAGPALAMHPEARALMEACTRASVPAFVSGSGPTVVVLSEDDASRPALISFLEAASPGAVCIPVRGPVPGAHLV